MEQNPLDKFFYVIFPYLIGSLSIVLLFLLLLQLKYYKNQGKEYPFVIRQSLLVFRSLQLKLTNISQITLDKLIQIMPAKIKIALSPKNRKLKNFVLKYQKIIIQVYGIIMLLIAKLASHDLLHKRVLFLPIFIALAATIVPISKLLAFLTENIIFMVCPHCGYTNKNLVDKCALCDNKNTSSQLPQNLIPAPFLTEISEYKKVNAYCEIPISILKGLNLSNEEFILIFKRLLPIRKNGSRRQRDVNGLPCGLNSICLSNQKIYFIASVLGGWRTIESYPYTSVIDDHTETRFMADPMELFDDVDKLIIRMDNGNEYLFKGFNPKKLFLAIQSCIRRRKLEKTRNNGSD